MLVALLVCLIPTTIGGLLSAIGIAGMDRMIQRNVIAMSGRAVEAAGDVDVLLLDKTGTITLGNRQAVEFIPVGDDPAGAAGRCRPAGLAGRRNARRPQHRGAGQGEVRPARRTRHRPLGAAPRRAGGMHFVPFTAQTRMSGVDLRWTPASARARRMRSLALIQKQGNHVPPELQTTVDTIARAGGTPLVVARNGQALGVIHLKDIVKGGIKERFAQLRNMGIKTVMITGDNPLTAAAIAAEAGVDDFLAQATPEAKLKLIREYQTAGGWWP